MSSLTELQLNRQLYKTQPQTLETLGANDVASNLSNPPSTTIASGNSVTDVNTNAETINGGSITPGTIPPSTLDVSNWGWTQTCAFTSASATQVNWGVGTFVSANGVSYPISAGNTGAMGAKTYIYLDVTTSLTTYQVTTTSSNAVGVGKVLVAVAQNGASAATFNLNVATQIVGDNILANTIDASKIVAGSITATQINASYVYAGTITADQVTAGTLTGSTVQTTSSGLRIVLGPSGATDELRFMSGATVYGSIFPFVFPAGTGISIESITADAFLNLSEGTHNSASFGTVDADISFYDADCTIDANVEVTGTLKSDDDFTYQTIVQPVVYYGYCSATTISKTNTSFTLTNPSTGKYTVTHNFGNTNYTVTATTLKASGTGDHVCKIESLNNDDFKVTTFTSDDGVVGASDFMFNLCKIP